MRFEECSLHHKGVVIRNSQDSRNIPQRRAFGTFGKGFWSIWEGLLEHLGRAFGTFGKGGAASTSSTGLSWRC